MGYIKKLSKIPKAEIAKCQEHNLPASSHYTYADVSKEFVVSKGTREGGKHEVQQDLRSMNQDAARAIRTSFFKKASSSHVRDLAGIPSPPPKKARGDKPAAKRGAHAAKAAAAAVADGTA